jgi:hypothetical protein
LEGTGLVAARPAAGTNGAGHDIAEQVQLHVQPPLLQQQEEEVSQPVQQPPLAWPLPQQQQQVDGPPAPQQAPEAQTRPQPSAHVLPLLVSQPPAPPHHQH